MKILIIDFNNYDFTYDSFIEIKWKSDLTDSESQEYFEIKTDKSRVFRFVDDFGDLIEKYDYEPVMVKKYPGLDISANSKIILGLILSDEDAVMLELEGDREFPIFDINSVELDGGSNDSE